MRTAFSTWSMHHTSSLASTDTTPPHTLYSYLCVLEPTVDFYLYFCVHTKKKIHVVGTLYYLPSLCNSSENPTYNMYVYCVRATKRELRMRAS